MSESSRASAIWITVTRVPHARMREEGVAAIVAGDHCSVIRDALAGAVVRLRGFLHAPVVRQRTTLVADPAKGNCLLVALALVSKFGLFGCSGTLADDPLEGAAVD